MWKEYMIAWKTMNFSTEWHVHRIRSLIVYTCCERIENYIVYNQKFLHQNTMALKQAIRIFSMYHPLIWNNQHPEAYVAPKYIHLFNWLNKKLYNLWTQQLNQIVKYNNQLGSNWMKNSGCVVTNMYIIQFLGHQVHVSCLVTFHDV